MPRKTCRRCDSCAPKRHLHKLRHFTKVLLCLVLNGSTTWLYLDHTKCKRQGLLALLQLIAVQGLLFDILAPLGVVSFQVVLLCSRDRPVDPQIVQGLLDLTHAVHVVLCLAIKDGAHQAAAHKTRLGGNDHKQTNMDSPVYNFRVGRSFLSHFSHLPAAGRMRSHAQRSHHVRQCAELSCCVPAPHNGCCFLQCSKPQVSSTQNPLLANLVGCSTGLDGVFSQARYKASLLFRQNQHSRNFDRCPCCGFEHASLKVKGVEDGTP